MIFWEKSEICAVQCSYPGTTPFVLQDPSLPNPCRSRSSKWEIHWITVKSIKETTQAFVVRIWIEPRQMSDAEPIWRGVIERVDNGDRVCFNQLDKMNTYFAKYLNEIGIKIDNVEKWVRSTMASPSSKMFAQLYGQARKTLLTTGYGSRLCSAGYRLQRWTEGLPDSLVYCRELSLLNVEVIVLLDKSPARSFKTTPSTNTTVSIRWHLDADILTVHWENVADC